LELVKPTPHMWYAVRVVYYWGVDYPWNVGVFRVMWLF